MAYISTKQFISVLMFIEENKLKPCLDTEQVEDIFTDYKYWLDAKGGISSINKENVEALTNIRSLVMKIWIRNGIDETRKRESSYKKKYLFWFLRTRIKFNLSYKFISQIAMCDEANVMFHLKDVESLDSRDKYFQELTKDLKEDLNKTLKKYMK